MDYILFYSPMKIFVLGFLFSLILLGLIGCGSSAATATGDKEMTASSTQNPGEVAPKLSPEQAAEFKASVSKKAKKGAKGDE